MEEMPLRRFRLAFRAVRSGVDNVFANEILTRFLKKLFSLLILTL